MENHDGMISTGELLICPPELSDNLTSSHLVENQEGLGERNNEYVLGNIFVHTSR
jgi:hypothetical protein